MVAGAGRGRRAVLASQGPAPARPSRCAVRGAEPPTPLSTPARGAGPAQSPPPLSPRRQSGSALLQRPRPKQVREGWWGSRRVALEAGRGPVQRRAVGALRTARRPASCRGAGGGARGAGIPPGMAGPLSRPRALASSALHGRPPLAPPGGPRGGPGHLMFCGRLGRLMGRGRKFPPPAGTSRRARGRRGTIHISGEEARKRTSSRSFFFFFFAKLSGIM